MTRPQRASCSAIPPLLPRSAAMRDKRRQTSAISIALRGLLLQTSSICAKKPVFSANKPVGLTTFVTTTQESTQKTPWIDDVCNNAQPNIPSSLQPPISTSGPTGTEGAGRPRGPGCGARGRWRGLAGFRGDAPSEARCADGSRAGRRPRRSLAQRGHKQSPEQRHNKQRGVRSASAPRTPSASVAHRLS